MTKYQIAKVVQGYTSELMDRAAIFEHNDDLVIVVADGAGGIGGGVQAAEMVVRLIGNALATNFVVHDPTFWVQLLVDIDLAIQQDLIAGETTAVVLAISANHITGASVGDSGAWLILPHTYNDLTQNQHRKPFLGTGVAIPVPFSSQQLQGTLLMATDGLLKYTSAEKICDIAIEDNIDIASKRLIDLVRLTSGNLHDDTTVVLCRF